MALITRLSRLFTADLHAVLDRVEEPEIMLRQAVRDMEAAVADTEREVRALESRLALARSAKKDAEAALEDAESQLSVCLDADDDALARSVIRRKLELERRLKGLNERTGHLERVRDERVSALAVHRRELDALTDTTEAVAEPGDTACSTRLAGAPVTAEEVEVALLREKQRRARS